MQVVRNVSDLEHLGHAMMISCFAHAKSYTSPFDSVIDGRAAPWILSAMTEYGTASLAIAEVGLHIAGATAFASAISAVAAVDIRRFGIAMNRSNKRRTEADRRRVEPDERRAEVERDRHEESMTALKELVRRTAPPQAGPAEWRIDAAAKPSGSGSFHPPQRVDAQGEFGPARSPNAVGLVGAGLSGRSSAWWDCRPAPSPASARHGWRCPDRAAAPPTAEPRVPLPWPARTIRPRLGRKSSSWFRPLRTPGSNGSPQSARACSAAMPDALASVGEGAPNGAWNFQSPALEALSRFPPRSPGKASERSLPRPACQCDCGLSDGRAVSRQCAGMVSKPVPTGRTQTRGGRAGAVGRQ